MRVRRPFLLACLLPCCVALPLPAQTEPAPAAPPPSAPDQGSAAGADKPSGDALAQEAESKPGEPKEDEKRKPSAWSGHFALLANGGDALYYFDLGVGAEISEHFELEVALIDEYERKPPTPDIKSNDLAGIVSLGYKL